MSNKYKKYLFLKVSSTKNINKILLRINKLKKVKNYLE